MPKELKPKASNRRIAKALGVRETTVRRDTATNVASRQKNTNQNNARNRGAATNVAPAEEPRDPDEIMANLDPKLRAMIEANGREAKARAFRTLAEMLRPETKH